LRERASERERDKEKERERDCLVIAKFHSLEEIIKSELDIQFTVLNDYCLFNLMHKMTVELNFSLSLVQILKSQLTNVV